MAFSFVSSLSLLSSCFISLVRNNNSLETLEVDGAYIFFLRIYPMQSGKKARKQNSVKS